GLLRERILAMKQIWAEDEAEFHGKYVNFDKLWSYPKPVQKPHPPILMGGDSPKTFDRIVEFCDGWMPVGMRLSELDGKAKELRQRAQAAGRDPKSISISIFNAKAEKAALDEMERCGAERAVFMVPAAGRDTVLPILDGYAALVK
ncbi:MAG: LLM class flavin-dependent oxidoreductase, partial [Blastocatellia bacterium]